MSAIREQIRAILREELAALAEPMPQITTETVQISSSVDLMRFAQDILTRAACPTFVANMATGRIRFTLPEIRPAAPPDSIYQQSSETGGRSARQKSSHRTRYLGADLHFQNCTTAKACTDNSLGERRSPPQGYSD